MEFYNPNIAVKGTTPEGHAGAYAGFHLPFHGYWFSSGQQIEFHTGELVQQPSRPLLGISRPDTFRKDCCSCPEAPAVL